MRRRCWNNGGCCGFWGWQQPSRRSGENFLLAARAASVVIVEMCSRDPAGRCCERRDPRYCVIGPLRRIRASSITETRRNETIQKNLKQVLRRAECGGGRRLRHERKRPLFRDSRAGRTSAELPGVVHGAEREGFKRYFGAVETGTRQTLSLCSLPRTRSRGNCGFCASSRRRRRNAKSGQISAACTRKADELMFASTVLSNGSINTVDPSRSISEHTRKAADVRPARESRAVVLTADVVFSASGIRFVARKTCLDSSGSFTRRAVMHRSNSRQRR